MASVIGRTFSAEALCAVSALQRDTVQAGLRALAEAGLAYRRRGHAEVFEFKHALVRDAAYNTLLRGRRRKLHEATARFLEQYYPELSESEPEVLAQHFTEAGAHGEAVHYWQRAGQRALQRSAHVEAVSHLSAGIQALGKLPETPENAFQELELQTTIGPSLQLLHGWASPQAEEAFGRARQLCERSGDSQLLFDTVRGLYDVSYIRANYAAARALSAQLLRLAEDQDDPLVTAVAEVSEGMTCMNLGELDSARFRFDRAASTASADSSKNKWQRFGHSPRVRAHGWAGWGLWLLGFPEQAAEAARKARDYAEELAHPGPLVFALNSSAVLYHFRREPQVAAELAGRAFEIAQENSQDFYLAYADMILGMADSVLGDAEQGASRMERSMRKFQETMANATITLFRGWLASAYGRADQSAAGLAILEQAIAFADASHERAYEAELHRIYGVLLAQSVRTVDEAESSFLRALDVARAQNAKSLELRAATDLARYWNGRGEAERAKELLFPVHGWFTEGLDTPDLVEATDLLAQLS